MENKRTTAARLIRSDNSHLRIVSPGAAPTPRAAPRPDWAKASAFRPDPVTPVRIQLTLGEKLVLFFRLNGEALSFWFAMGSIALLVGMVAGAFIGAIR